MSARERRLVEALHAWGSGALRDLPWRRTRDPWAVLVSEAMLQQTQVARVLDRYGPFLARFPDPAAMADAPLAEVLDAWAGLGYYRRARDLRRAAVAIVQRHDGRVPDDLDALLALPGIGAYTARAVLALAFEHDHGVVDTNVARVLARAVAGEPMTADACAAARGHARAGRCGMAAQPGAARPRRDGLHRADPRAATSVRWSTAASGAVHRTSRIRRARPRGTSRPQAPFAGSDRQGRGRLLAALRGTSTAGVAAEQLDGVTGFADDARARRVADGLVADGLARWDGDVLRAPR